MPDIRRNQIEHFPIKGVFEPDYFVLSNIDTVMLDFLKHVVMALPEYLTISMFAFFHHPTVEKNNHIFFRWFVNNPSIGPLDKDLMNNFQKYDSNECVGFNLAAQNPNTALSASFLQELSAKLKSQKYHAIKDIDLKLKNKRKTEKVERVKKAGFWLINNPSRFKGFTDPLVNKNTTYSIYYPLLISNRLVGLFAVDSIAQNLDNILTNPKNPSREKFEAVLRLMNITIECIFKSYYSQLDNPPTNDLDNYFWKRNDECLVFGPTFLNELKILLCKGFGSYDRYQLYDKSIKCYFVSYWDANGIKQINDHLSSHATGTEIIRTVGEWIYECFNDIKKKIGLKFWIVRWGGDEFIVIAAGNKQLSLKERQFINGTLSTMLRSHIKKSLSPLIIQIKKWKRCLNIKGSKKTIEDVLRRVGLSGGWSWCNKGKNIVLDDAKDNAEKTMYVAKAITKGPFGGKIGCVALEFNSTVNEYHKFLDDNNRSSRKIEKLLNQIANQIKNVKNDKEF